MEYLWLKFAHIIAFVYWLGGDLGTFFGSQYVIKTDIGAQARAIALKIMLACDQGPKMAMPLIFPIGLQMAVISNLVSIPFSVMMMIWSIAVLWLANVLYLHVSENAAGKALVTRVDFYLRLLVVLLISVYAIAGLIDSSLIRADYISYKMLIFALLVSFGLMVRVSLKDFMPAFAELKASGASDSINARMTRSMKLAKPWVWGIWVGLFANAMIGLHLFNGSTALLILTVVTALSPLPLLAIARKRYGGQ